MSYHDMSPRPLIEDPETGKPKFALTGDEARVEANWRDPRRGAPLANWTAKDVQPLVRQDGPSGGEIATVHPVLGLPLRGIAPDGTRYYGGVPQSGRLPTTFAVQTKIGPRGDWETAVAPQPRRSSPLTPRRVIFQG